MSILKDFYEDNYTRILILEKTLKEIKEIAEKRNYLDYNEALDDILALITKAESEG